MELFILTDAIKRGSAKSVNLVIPYGYQDKKGLFEHLLGGSCCPFIETLNVNRVMIFDFAGQAWGFFSNNCPVDNLYAEPYFMRYHREIQHFVCGSTWMKTNYRASKSGFQHVQYLRIEQWDCKMMLIGELKIRMLL